MNVWGHHVYIGRCSVHQRNTMSKSGGDIMSTLEDVQDIRGDIMMHLGE